MIQTLSHTLTSCIRLKKSVFVIIGHSSRRLLLVVYIEIEEDFIRIISARRASKSEKKRYEKGE